MPSKTDRLASADDTLSIFTHTRLLGTFVQRDATVAALYARLRKYGFIQVFFWHCRLKLYLTGYRFVELPAVVRQRLPSCLANTYTTGNRTYTSFGSTGGQNVTYRKLVVLASTYAMYWDGEKDITQYSSLMKPSCRIGTSICGSVSSKELRVALLTVGPLPSQAMGVRPRLSK